MLCIVAGECFCILMLKENNQKKPNNPKLIKNLLLKDIYSSLKDINCLTN